MGQRTLLLRVRQWLAAASAERAGVLAGDAALDQLRRASSRCAPTRRRILAGMGATGAVAGGLLPLIGCGRDGFKSNPGNARVVIVGGGLAGMAALNQLAKKGIYAELYEALSTPGGRVVSGEGLFYGAPKLNTELGGEFIDSGHVEILDLVDELGLTLLDRQQDTPLDMVYFVDGARYTERDLLDRMGTVAGAIDYSYSSIEDEGENLSYEDDAGAFELDNQSIADFLTGCDADPVIYRVLESAYRSAYGLDLEDQSALNLIFMLGTDPAQLELYGTSDERYSISGGNAQICSLLADIYRDRVHFDAALESIKEASNGTYTLSFADGAEVEADYVILTLPFTVLRRLNLQFEMSDIKRTCINELGYGTSSKLIVPFSTRFWRDRGESGEIFTDLYMQSSWDSSAMQDGNRGTLTAHLGGQGGIDLGTGTVADQAALILADLDAMYEGSSALAGDDPQRVHWPSVETALGGYACYKVGQYTSIGGAEGEPVSRILFAGEHCSYECQGYMNGAVETGVGAANELAAELEGARKGLFSWRRARAARRFPRVARPAQR